MKLSYPAHFLHDLDSMSPAQRINRANELVSWAKRLADDDANPKWTKAHLFELAQLLENAQHEIGVLRYALHGGSALTPNAELLEFLAARLTNVYGENPRLDYILACHTRAALMRGATRDV